MKTITRSIIVLSLILFSTLMIIGCSDEDDEKTCSDAVSNLWDLTQSSDRSDVCDAYYNLSLQGDILDDDDGTPWSLSNCNSYSWNLSESLFKNVFMGWCTGSDGNDDAWSQSSIDCNAALTDITQGPCE